MPARSSPLTMPSLPPVSTTKGQAEDIFHRIGTLSSRRVEHSAINNDLVMLLVWKHLSAAGHIALYQCSIHDRDAKAADGKQMVQIPVDGPERRQSERNEPQVWDDPQMPVAEPPDPIAVQLEQAVNFVQSPDYDALTTKICEGASRAFNRLTHNRCTDGMVVVMDIDGTVMNNSPWMADLCRKGQLSTQESLNRWAVSKKAKAVCGVLRLVDTYRIKQVPVAWVSNRTEELIPGSQGDEVRKATQAHLESLGLYKDGDQILLKGDFPGNNSTGEIDLHKRHRFEAIRQGHVFPGRTDIVQMVGDALADLDIEDAEPFYSTDSNNWPKNIKDEIGEKRILMANPLFRPGWYRSLLRHWAASQKQKLPLTLSLSQAAMNRQELEHHFNEIDR